LLANKQDHQLNKLKNYGLHRQTRKKLKIYEIFLNLRNYLFNHSLYFRLLFIAIKKESCSRNVSINPAFNKIKAFILINNNKLMTKENLKEYIELLKHRISISTSEQEITQFEELIKEAEEELKQW
jgi:hypothetical protein